MLLFGLMLPVLLGFVGLSMAASNLLNARNKLDHTTLAASIGASSDACMVSPYAFDLYKCTNPAAQSSYASWPGTLPQPAFTASTQVTPAIGTVCSDSTQCVGTGDGTCSPSPCDEHSAAQASANNVVSQVLQANYPGFTVTNCPLPATNCGTLVTPSNIEYQVWVSYWYYYDSDDEHFTAPTASSGGTPPQATSDTPSDDGGGNLTAATGGTPVTDSDSDTSASTANLLCPATLDATGHTKFARTVTVLVWVEYTNPFAGVLGLSASTMRSSATTAGCSA